MSLPLISKAIILDIQIRNRIEFETLQLDQDSDESEDGIEGGAEKGNGQYRRRDHSEC